MCIEDLALNNLQWLICDKPNHYTDTLIPTYMVYCT